MAILLALQATLKQHSKVKNIAYLGCTLDEIMSGESMSLRVIKLNPDLNFYIGYNITGNYLLKVNNRNNRTRCEICSKLTIKTSFLYCEIWIYFASCSCVSIVNFEHVIAGRECIQLHCGYVSQRSIETSPRKWKTKTKSCKINVFVIISSLTKWSICWRMSLKLFTGYP